MELMVLLRQIALSLSQYYDRHEMASTARKAVVIASIPQKSTVGTLDLAIVYWLRPVPGSPVALSLEIKSVVAGRRKMQGMM